MQVIISKEIGFCSGVRRAIMLAISALDSNDDVYCVGNFIHNERVVADLKKRGLKVVGEIDLIPAKATVLVRAHGEIHEKLETLKKRECFIIDATCPSVSCIIEKTIMHEKEGKFIVIFGKKNHPEILALTSNLNNYYVTDDIDDVSFWNFASSFYVVFQTTFSTYMHKEHIFKLHDNGATLGKLVDIFDSICYTTLARRDSCFEIASKSDIMLVFGDKNSNNTQELYKMLISLSKETYLLSTFDDFTKLIPQLIKTKTIGLVAGASTPYELIEEVIDLMKSLNQENEEANVDKIATDNTAEDLNKEESMQDIFEQISDKVPQLREGQIMEVEVVRIDSSKDELYVSFDTHNRKNDHGFISSENLDLEGKRGINDFKIGERFQALILDAKKTASIEFSKKAYEDLQRKEAKVLELESGKDVAFVCTDVDIKEKNNRLVEQGLIFKVGRYKIFAPKSQIVLPRGKRLSNLKGKEVLLRLLPSDNDNTKKSYKYNLLAGQKAIFDEKDNEFWDNFAIVGKIVKGQVIRYGEKDGHIFGAFVSVDNHDCLAHISEITWEKNADPKEILEVGKEYDFQVLETDREKNKVSLSYKRLFKSPIDVFSEKNPVGSTVSGTVAKILPFGAFVTLADGIDGMVHISQVAHERIEKIESFLSVGQSVEAKVLKYEDQRVSLSIKDLIVVNRTQEIDVSQNSRKSDKFNIRKSAAQTVQNEGETSNAGTSKKKQSSKRDIKEQPVQTFEKSGNSSSGATFGDTEEAKKLMRLVSEDTEE